MGVLRNRRAMAVLSPALFLLLWELAVRAGLISLDTFTSPVQVFWALKEIAFGENLALRGRLDTHMLASLESVLLGFLVATAVGVPLGILLGWSEVLHNFFDPVVELLRPIPPMAWVPLSLLLLGIGLQQKVFVVFLGTFAPTLISTVGGAKNLDPLILKVAQTHNASQVDTLFKVYLPALLPTIFTTCRRSPLSSGRNFWIVVKTTPPAPTRSFSLRSTRLSACTGGWRSRSWQRENVPNSWSSRSFRSVSTTSVGFLISELRITRPA